MKTSKAVQHLGLGWGPLLPKYALDRAMRRAAVWMEPNISALEAPSLPGVMYTEASEVPERGAPPRITALYLVKYGPST